VYEQSICKNVHSPAQSFAEWTFLYTVGTDVKIFEKYFCQKIGETIGVLTQKQIQIMQNYKHLIGFREERQFFRPKIVENRRKLWSKHRPLSRPHFDSK
jgi:hypothetical protein